MMEVKYDKQRHQFEVNVDEKLIRFEDYPDDPNTLTDCESVCPLAKNGIDCAKLRHPNNKRRRTLMDFCAELPFDYRHLLDGVGPNNFIPNYWDIMEFYTSVEIKNAGNYVPNIIEF